MANQEVWVSVDIEADGPIPGEYSMLSLGATALFAKGVTQVSFYKKLRPLPGAKQHPDTMAWWSQHPEAWAEANKDPEDPTTVMVAFKEWLESLPGRPVFVGYPVAWDFTHVFWYYWKFVGEQPPWGHQGLDIKTAAMMRLGTPYSNTTKSRFPRYWFSGADRELAHRADEDAAVQEILLRNILRDEAPPPECQDDFLKMLDRLVPEIRVPGLRASGHVSVPEIAKIVAVALFTQDRRDPRVATVRAYLRALARDGFFVFRR